MRKYLPLILCIGLTGCADPMTNLVLGGATVVSYSVLGQSPGDYALSEYKDQNCDIRNPKRNDGHYCVDRNQAALTEPPLYCYRTLGSPDCSSQIDPHNNGVQPIVMPADRMIGRAPGITTPLPTYDVDRDMPVSLTPAARSTPPAAPSPPPLSPADNALEDEKNAPPIGS